MDSSQNQICCKKICCLTLSQYCGNSKGPYLKKIYIYMFLPYRDTVRKQRVDMKFPLAWCMFRISKRPYGAHESKNKIMVWRDTRILFRENLHALQRFYAYFVYETFSCVKYVLVFNTHWQRRQPTECRHTNIWIPIEMLFLSQSNKQHINAQFDFDHLTAFDTILKLERENLPDISVHLFNDIVYRFKLNSSYTI